MKAGSRAPAFRLQDETGEWVALESFRGRRVVLFFFQKASTPGCTVEACEFRDALPRFAAHDVTVVGISPDTWRRHAKFKAAQRLPYTLLADKEAITCQAYGVWLQKLFWGRHYMGVQRSTFAIGTDGRVERIWRDVHHEGHAAEVAAWIAGEPAPADASLSNASRATPRRKGTKSATRGGNASKARRRA